MANPALDFVTQALNDFAQTMQPSVRASFIRTANEAVQSLNQQLQPAVVPAGEASDGAQAV